MRGNYFIYNFGKDWKKIIMPIVDVGQYHAMWKVV